jgi:hypothetical protein
MFLNRIRRGGFLSLAFPAMDPYSRLAHRFACGPFLCPQGRGVATSHCQRHVLSECFIVYHGKENPAQGCAGPFWWQDVALFLHRAVETGRWRQNGLFAS